MQAEQTTLLDGRFELLDELGVGAFGRVFRAHDRLRNAIVALKRLAHVDADSLYRFKREFRAVADVAHPNVVTLHELFVDAREPFFTMELVAGVDFVTWVRRPDPVAETLLAIDDDTTPIDEARLRSCLGQLASAVHALHALGMVHRDLKPSNVMVRNDGHVLVLDFGLVVDTDNTRSALMGAGTPAYMAPEQSRGEKVGPAADWYAVGGMLYEALTGHMPFEGSAREILRQKQLDGSPDPLALAPRAPRDLAELSVRLLAREPSDRPTGEAIIAELGVVSQRAPGRRGALFGRAAELAALDESLRRVDLGRPSVAFVHGPSGIGKSSILRAFAAKVAAAGALVLHGRCYEREQVPFKGLDGMIEALSRHLAALRPVDAATLMPRDTDSLVLLFPALLRNDVVQRACRGKATIEDPVERRRRGARALRELLQRCGDAAPTVVILDDVQWSDDDSAMILADVLLPPDAPSIALVLSYRDEEGSDDLVRAAVPRGHVHAIDVAVGPLDARSAADLATEAGATGDLDAIVRESGGNPFFLGELARASTQSALVALADVVLARLDRLPDDARRILETIAVAGQPIAREAVRHAAAVDGGTELEAMATLRRESLVRTTGNGELETYHDRIRETIVAMSSAENLRARHAALAAAFEGTAAPQVLAYHLRQAGDHERARSYAEAAGDHAMRTLAFDRAAAHFADAASGAGAGPDLLEKLAEALVGAGRGREAAETFLRASAMREAEEGDELRRRAVEAYFRTGLFAEGITTIRPLLARAGLPMPVRRRRTMALIVWNAILLFLAWRTTKSTDPRALVRARLCATLSAIGNYDPFRSMLYVLRGAREARRSGDRALYARLLSVSAALFGIRRMTEEAAAIVRTLPDAERRPLEGVLAFGGAFRAIMDGELVVAVDKLRFAEERAAGEHLAWERGIIRVWLLEGLWQRGDLREFVRRAREHLLEYRIRGDTFGTAWVETGLLRRAMFVEDRPDEARAIGARNLPTQRPVDDFIGFLSVCGVCECPVYDDDATGARVAHERLKHVAAKSLLMSGGSRSVMRAYALGCLGLTAVVAGDVEAVARAARRLERERPFGMDVFYAPLLRAGVARDPAEAYDRAAAALASQYPMHAEAARFRAAEARADEDGQRRELAALAARGATNPRSFARLLAPRMGTPRA